MQTSAPHRRLSAICTVAGITILSLFFAWQAYCWWLDRASANTPLPRYFGNSAANLAAASAGSKPGQGTREIRFGVVADSRGYGAFRTLMDALKDAKPDFVILNGDIARTSKPGDHRFLRWQMATEMATDFPVLYLIGNHDIGPRYTLKEWEAAYGPSQCFFIRDGNAFVMTHIAEEDDPAAVDVLDSNLRRVAPSARRIFVFNHIPPPIGYDWEARTLPQQKRFLEVLERYKVDYLITGDYHGYARVQRGALNVVVTGGGGADLKGGAFGFHHAMLFTVRDGGVQERISAAPARLALTDVLESGALAEFIPFAGAHFSIVVIIDTLSLALLVLLIVKLVRTRSPRAAH